MSVDFTEAHNWENGNGSLDEDQLDSLPNLAARQLRFGWQVSTDIAPEHV